MAENRLVLFGISFAIALPLAAAPITLGGTAIAGQGLVSSVADATTVDFNGLSNGGPQAFVSGIATYLNAFIRSAGGTDIANDSSPFVNPLSTGGDLTISFARPIGYFGLYWGSPDPLNTITFFNGATLLATFTGQDLNNQLGVGFGSGIGAYVNFTADAGQSVTRIVMSAAGSFPFEQDNHAFLVATPEVSSHSLTALGLGLIVVRRLAGQKRKRLRLSEKSL